MAEHSDQSAVGSSDESSKLTAADSIDSGEYCPFPQPETRLSAWEQLTLQGGAELDKLLRWLGRKFLSITVSPEQLRQDTPEILAELKFYRSPGFLVNSAEFFIPPQYPPRVCLSKPHRLSKGEVIDLSFRSDFTPYYQPFAATYRRHVENQTAYARYWRHRKGGSLGTMIAIHGWNMGDQRINALALQPGFFFKLGLDVVLYELPYHGRRAGAAGDHVLFPSIGIARTNEGIAQAICDLRSIVLWLKEQGRVNIGVHGVSLGGYTAALWSGLDPLSFIIASVPVVSLADLAWTILHESPLGEQVVPQRLFEQVSLGSLREAYEVHSPLRYAPRVPHERRMVIASTGDPLIPAWQPQKLREHWQNPATRWFSGGHLNELQIEAMRGVHEFLTSLGLAYPEPLEIEAQRARKKAALV